MANIKYISNRLKKIYPNPIFWTLVYSISYSIWSAIILSFLSEITVSVPFRSAPVNACSWTPQATWCLLIVYEGLSDLNLPQKPATNISTVSDDGKVPTVSEVKDEHMSFLKWSAHLTGIEVDDRCSIVTGTKAVRLLGLRYPWLIPPTHGQLLSQMSDLLKRESMWMSDLCICGPVAGVSMNKTISVPT